MEELFESFREADDVMLANIYELAKWLMYEATATLRLLDADKFDEANGRIKTAGEEVLPNRRAISKAMRDLLSLQAEFIEIFGVVS